MNKKWKVCCELEGNSVERTRPPRAKQSNHTVTFRREWGTGEKYFGAKPNVVGGTENFPEKAYADSCLKVIPGRLVGCLVFKGTFNTNRLYRATGV